MSADNYLAIYKKKDSKFYAYDLSASCPTPKRPPKQEPEFVAETMEEAIIKAQDYYSEYGYIFVNLKRKRK